MFKFLEAYVRKRQIQLFCDRKFLTIVWGGGRNGLPNFNTCLKFLFGGNCSALKVIFVY